MMKKLVLALAVLFLTAPFALALDSTVTVTWTAPTYFATGGDCDATATAIPIDYPLMYSIKYRVGSGPEQTATTGGYIFTFPAVVGSTAYAKVGAYGVGGTVSCWTDEASVVVPVPSCGKPANVKLEIK
jgi:hypothetical protein